jgi:hypothetical protein
MKRLGDPEELQGTLLCLAYDISSFVTGVVIHWMAVLMQILEFRVNTLISRIRWLNFFGIALNKAHLGNDENKS